MKKILSFFIWFLLFTVFLSCRFISSFTEEPVIELSFDKNTSNISIGQMDIVSLSISKNQNEASIKWEFDSSIISAKTDNYSAIITGLKPGQTTLKASCGQNSASCLVIVSDKTYSVSVTNPYVYTSTDYVEVEPNKTQKISASLFGGTPSDINGYSWYIDKPSIASLSTEGNYCWITGITEGIARLTVKHNKTPYGYSVLINCSSDGNSLTYITTSENIITINKSEQNTAEFSVNLMNPIVENYATAFSYTLVDELGTEISGPIDVVGDGSLTVSLTAHQTGIYYVRCSHPSAIYSLDVLVRVIENAEVAFIEPSSTFVNISGNESQNVSLSLLNYSGEVDNNLFSWKFSENAEKYISYQIFNGSTDTTGNNILIKGIKTGSCKITVSYPGLADRNIIVIVRDIESEAASAKTYITTSQNFIRMGLNDEAQKILISLVDSKNCDINELKWSIINCASDGSSKDVIKWITGIGQHTVSSVNPRSMILGQNNSAHATIQPVNPGIAYIDISHPKAIYKTRITVNVSETSTEVIESSVLSLTGSPVINILNGETETAYVLFSGDGNEDDIQWSSDNPLITLSPNGKNCVITSPASGSGVNKATVQATHVNATYPVKFSILCYDTEEELSNNAIKTMYSLDSSAILYVGNTVKFSLYTQNFDENQKITWQISEGNNFIDFETSENNTVVNVTAKSVGKAILKASSNGVDDVYFVIDVKDQNIIESQEVCYLSTYTNVIYFEDENVSKDIEISAFNISESSYSDITFTCDSTLFEIASNGNKATITSLSKSAKAILTVSHPYSENTLQIYLHCGGQYEYVNEDFCFITTDKETIELYAGQDEVQLTAMLNHTEISDSQEIPKGFTFVSDNPDIASVSYVTYSNYCYVKPLKNGTAKITITHPESEFEKDVIVIVNNAPDSSSIPYITTKTNVITIVQGEYATATVELKNSTDINNAKWSWTSNDSRICDVIANNGTSSLISANKPGTTEVTVRHEDCIYPLKLIIVVLDASIVSNRPYIKASENIITLKKGTSTSITAEIIGSNSDSDKNYFRFNGSNSAIILVNGASDSAYIKAIDTGMAYVTISNSRYSDSYSKTVLVIVEDTVKEGCYIKTSNSIVKLKPDEKNLVKISAELVGGEPIDGERFIWWADDYNLIGINSLADQCSIMPTGKTGTTKVHIKHEKASKVCDILVMISNYDTFAFSTNSLVVNSEKLYFIPMQVPAIEEEFDIKYYSSDENVCIIDGSNSVAWICGIDYGNASLTAKIVSRKDNIELASCEMLVSVTVPDPIIPKISLGNSILTVEAGTSQTLSAIITGENIDENEKYNLKWNWVCGSGDAVNGISMETPDKTAFGPDTYVTFSEAGEYVIYVTHEISGATTSMYVIVEEKGEITIELNSYLETIYKDDGSITLTATLHNASESDYQNIEWSAIKVGGQNIVAVSKNKGKNCTVTPKNVGQTSVIARLPNGQTAKCVVIVKASAEISLDLGTLHIIPGYTQVVNYKVTPQNSTINWITQMSNFSMTENLQYFSFEDDTVKKQLRITGLKDYPGGAAGTITGYIVGASSANMASLKVFVEYDMELSLLDMSGNRLTILNNEKPDTANVKKFQIKYYPIDLDIDICVDNNILSCVHNTDNELNHTANPNQCDLFTIGEVQKKVINEDGIDKCLLTVSVVPHSEGTKDISVVATLPSDVAGQYKKEESFRYNSYYKDGYTLILDLTKYSPVGAFTKIENGTLCIGDGEEAIFSVRIAEENAVGKILTDKIKWEPNITTQTELTINKSDLQTTDRNIKASTLFRESISKTSDNIKTTAKAKAGFLYLTTDNKIEGQSVFRFSHMWDYYKDLPDEVNTEEKWKNYKAYNQDRLYKEDFISDLDVDYWIVTKEMMVDDYYTISHPYLNIPSNKVLTPKWEKSTSNAEKENDVGHTHYRDTIKFSTTGPKGKTIYEYTYPSLYTDGTRDDWHDWDHRADGSPLLGGTYYNAYGVTSTSDKQEICGPGYYCDIYPECYISEYTHWWHGEYYPYYPYMDLDINYETCIPYVITKEEFVKNEFYVRPSNCSCAIFKVEWDNSGETDFLNEKYFAKLLHDNISPTIDKDPRPSVIGYGKLKIYYTNAFGEECTNPEEIEVRFDKRKCEAYTNNNWNGPNCDNISYNNTTYDRYYLSKKLFDTSQLGNKSPSLSIDTSKNNHIVSNSITTTTAELVSDESILYIPYSIYPSSNNITISIPKGNLYLTSYDSKTEQTDNNIIYDVYKISNHETTSNGTGSGYLYLKQNGTYNGEITITGSGKTRKLNIEIDSNSIYVPKINSQDGIKSRYDADRRILIIGDGEQISGSIYNLDSSISNTISNIIFEPLSSMTDFNYISETDIDGKSQSSLVTCSVGGKGSTIATFNISHSKDYGYFGTNNGVIDNFYKKTFKLSDITIDESKLTFETVYITNNDVNGDGEITEDEISVDTEATEQNRQNAILAEKQKTLHNNKKAYVTQTSSSQVSYTFPYYYENNEIVLNNSIESEIEKEMWISKTENVHLIGRIVIDYGDVDFDGNKITQEIFVAVEVSNSPCKTTSSYGYEVPISYYSSITQ